MESVTVCLLKNEPATYRQSDRDQGSDVCASAEGQLQGELGE